MDDLDQLWNRLFGDQMSAFERDIVERLIHEPGIDDSVLVLAAIHVRSQWILFGKDNPIFRLASASQRSLEDLQRTGSAVKLVMGELYTSLNDLGTKASEAHHAFAEGRRTMQMLNPSFYFPRNLSRFPINWTSVFLICLAVFFSTLFGTVAGNTLTKSSPQSVEGEEEHHTSWQRQTD